MVLDTKIFQNNFPQPIAHGRPRMWSKLMQHFMVGPFMLSSCEQMFTGLKVGDWTRKFVHYWFPITGQNEQMTPTAIPFTCISLVKGHLAHGKGYRNSCWKNHRDNISNLMVLRCYLQDINSSLGWCNYHQHHSLYSTLKYKLFPCFNLHIFTWVCCFVVSIFSNITTIKLCSEHELVSWV